MHKEAFYGGCDLLGALPVNEHSGDCFLHNYLPAVFDLSSIRLLAHCPWFFTGLPASNGCDEDHRLLSPLLYLLLAGWSG